LTLPGKFPAAFVLTILTTRFRFLRDGGGANPHGADGGRGDFDGFRRKAEQRGRAPERVTCRAEQSQ